MGATDLTTKPTPDSTPDSTTEPTASQLQIFRNAEQDGPINMVNLLKFRQQAEYATGDAESDERLSGREAYQKYAAVAMQKILANGGSIDFLAPSEQCFVGGEEDDWDQVVIVRYPSRAAYLAGFDSADYQAAIRHRIAGLEKRLLLQCRPNQLG